ncbi:MAG: DUF3604 domain-containing protein, partial [Bacteroidota bacterium]
PHFVAYKIQLQRPLDFMAVTDHSEYMGIMMQMINHNSPLAKLELAEQVRSEDRAVSLQAFSTIGTSIAYNKAIDELVEEDIIKSTWQRIVEAANDHYEPGKFTTFPAYEWTSSPAGSGKGDSTFAYNLHRNVVYRGDQVSEVPFSSFNSQDPEQLWAWMDKERENGITMMAIPHNGNMSDGAMYASETFEGQPLSKAYAEARMRNEPINEVVQIKGQSMSHPTLSPNDEFAAFELYPYTFSTSFPPTSRPDGSYVRKALKDGLKIEQAIGANPYKFGLIGSSDGHNGGGSIEENNHFGKFGNMDGDAASRIKPGEKFLRAKYFSAAGLAAVWAEENTRESIYAALERKETFATSGPRIKLRFFAGYDLAEIDLKDEAWVKTAYQEGVAMGSDIPTGIKGKPGFLIHAVKDAEGANLDRVQIVKGWVDASGESQEKIFNVAWSGDRRLDENGDLTEVGNTVNVKEATYENSIGAIQLMTYWEDPDFDPSISAFYYVRVLEIPTPRWSTFDAHSLNLPTPNDVDETIRERAWSSPIWYKGQ